jgi:glyoxylase I family protein
MQVTGVHHVSLNVTELDRSLAFWVDVVGLVPVERPDLGFPGSWLAAGDQQLHLLAVGRVPADVGQHFAVAVDDLDAAVGELREAGVEVSDPSVLPTGARQSFCRDPDGNRLELHQPAG